MTEKYEQLPWCTKKVAITGLRRQSAVINLFDPRVCDHCGRNYFHGQTGKKLLPVEEVRPDGWEKHAHI